MKFLRDQLDKVEPLFIKGGKLERLYPLYEAKDTFLFTPGLVTKGNTHVRDSLDMKRMMSTVICCLGTLHPDGPLQHGLPSQLGNCRERSLASHHLDHWTRIPLIVK